ncbi:hypothetical protein [Candidatus Ichthyocystis hellenicum]|uniref:hypothetical protein n=1 Tax=Candidatus Ichthyocystis hellenicum TaxID=1561003 RepID=UPI000B85F2BC|nr:hypothetical protein [Candidatus Ichthyocystis hellenicum]
MSPQAWIMLGLRVYIWWIHAEVAIVIMISIFTDMKLDVVYENKSGNTKIKEIYYDNMGRYHIAE